MRASVEAWSRGDREAYLGDAHPDYGIETERDWAYVVTGRDGIPMRADNSATWAATLEAVRLRE